MIAVFYKHYIHTVDETDKTVARIYGAPFRYQTLREVLQIAPYCPSAVFNNKKTHLPVRSDCAATSKAELAHISAYLLPVSIYLLATPKVMEKLPELRTTQIYTVKWTGLSSLLESIISSKCAKEPSC